MNLKEEVYTEVFKRTDADWDDPFILYIGDEHLKIKCYNNELVRVSIYVEDEIYIISVEGGDGRVMQKSFSCYFVAWEHFMDLVSVDILSVDTLLSLGFKE